MARRSIPWRTFALALSAILSITVVVMVVRPGHDGGPGLPTGPAGLCPEGFFDRIGRAELVRQRLRETTRGRALLDALGDTEVRYCFGRIEVSSIAEGRVLVLDESAADVELAARVGHLLDHVVHGPPFPAEIDRGADCDRVVERALQQEARAYVLEVELRRELGITGQRYEFEAELAHAADPAGVVLEYLRAHPDGGPGLDALGAGYRLRCERERGR